MCAIIQVVESKNLSLQLVLSQYTDGEFRKKIESLTQALNPWEAMTINTDFEDAP